MPTRKELTNISRFSRLLTKFYGGEELDVDDWNDFISLSIVAITFVLAHTNVKMTQSTQQVHLQPSKKLKKGKKRKEG